MKKRIAIVLAVLASMCAVGVTTASAHYPDVYTGWYLVENLAQQSYGTYTTQRSLAHDYHYRGYYLLRPWQAYGGWPYHYCQEYYDLDHGYNVINHSVIYCQ